MVLTFLSSVLQRTAADSIDKCAYSLIAAHRSLPDDVSSGVHRVAMWPHSFSASQAGSCPATENAASREPLVSSSRSSGEFLVDNSWMVLFAASFFSLCFPFLGSWWKRCRLPQVAMLLTPLNSDLWPQPLVSLGLDTAYLGQACPEHVLLFRASLGKSLNKALCDRFVVLDSYKDPLCCSETSFKLSSYSETLGVSLEMFVSWQCM